VPVNIDEVIKALKAIDVTPPPAPYREVLTKAIADIEQYAGEQTATIAQLNKTIQAQGDQINQLQGQVTAQNTQITQQNAKITDLSNKLAAATAPSTTKPIDLATTFKTIMDSVQTQARAASGVASTTVKSMDVEIKGLVQIEADGSTSLQLPTVGAPLDAATLSTIRISYGAVPVAVPPAPPPPPPPPPSKLSAKPPRGGGSD